MDFRLCIHFLTVCRLLYYQEMALLAYGDDRVINAETPLIRHDLT